jgi:hypothetical protein
MAPEQVLVHCSAEELCPSGHVMGSAQEHSKISMWGLGLGHVLSVAHTGNCMTTSHITQKETNGAIHVLEMHRGWVLTVAESHRTELQGRSSASLQQCRLCDKRSFRCT